MYQKKQLLQICILLFVASTLLLSGCTKRYVITTELSTPYEYESQCVIGIIHDDLPVDMDPEDRPALEDVKKLRDFLGEEISARCQLDADSDLEKGRYEVYGTIMDFKKGSGFVRFLIGFGAGNAKLVTNLKLIDKNTDNVIFGGNFTSVVSDWSVDGEQIFRQVAQDFSKQLKKQMENLGKAPEEREVEKKPQEEPKLKGYYN